ncbi:MAG: hypothetical protein WD556_10480 [Actinomycetota bacterium]
MKRREVMLKRVSRVLPRFLVPEERPEVILKVLGPHPATVLGIGVALAVLVEIWVLRLDLGLGITCLLVPGLLVWQAAILVLVLSPGWIVVTDHRVLHLSASAITGVPTGVRSASPLLRSRAPVGFDASGSGSGR